MTQDGSLTGTRVELYTRRSLHDAAARRRVEVAGRLNRLATAGHVSGVEIDTWQKKVPLDGSSRERDLYEGFADWADEAGVSLEPFFDTRECYSMDTGQCRERLVLPVLCLAVYRGDELRSVYPHSTGTGSRSVLDCLQALESARPAVTSVTDGELDGEGTADQQSDRVAEARRP